MLSKLNIFVCSICLSIYCNAQTLDSPQLPARTKPGLINKYYQLSTLFGAGVSQCTTLSEIIKDGWPEARYLMILDMTSMGIKQDDATTLVDNNYNSAANMPPDSNIINSCDKVLDSLYAFEKEVSMKRPMNPSDDSITENK